VISKVTADTPVSDEVKNHPHTRLCAGHCNRWTRAASATLDEFPNTVTRSSGGKCQKCINDERRANPGYIAREDTNLRHTVTGLESFLSNRRQRLGQS
jgi:hypothetical protein